MINSVRFVAVLDTNVVYPVIIRDLLLWFAYYDLFTPKWSKHIFNEWKIVMERKGIAHQEIANRIQKVNLAFPDAQVQNYGVHIKTLTLTDQKDCHVLAAAIKT